jgi:hypothetical protein
LVKELREGGRREMYWNLGVVLVVGIRGKGMGGDYRAWDGVIVRYHDIGVEPQL